MRDDCDLIAKILTEAASTQKAISLISQDVSWLWRTAYNLAIQGCSEWEGCEGQITELFDFAKNVHSLASRGAVRLMIVQLLEALCQASPVDIDPELYLHLANAAFSAVSGRGDYLSTVTSYVNLLVMVLQKCS